jgi:hypothetical protein
MRLWEINKGVDKSLGQAFLPVVAAPSERG